MIKKRNQSLNKMRLSSPDFNTFIEMLKALKLSWIKLDQINVVETLSGLNWPRIEVFNQLVMD